MGLPMELKDVDLNLLLVFNDLLKEHAVSRVARNLGMSQPGVSNALNRLRRLLGDDLFLRTGRGMEPTPFAQRLAEPVAHALALIHDSLNTQMPFEPATATRNFTIAMTDIGEIDFLPRMMDEMNRQAPYVTVSTVRKSSENLREELETGQVDLAVGYIPDLKTGIFQRRLAVSQYVCLFRRGHPLDKERISREEFAAAQHLAVVFAGTGHILADQELERAGVRRNIRLRVPHFAAVGQILHETDMIATMPKRLVMRLISPFDLAWVALPYKLSQIPLNLFWSAKYQHDPANRWLRTLMFDTCHEPSSRAAA
ncbi:MAG TPA: LysR family transcriptional regulator [Burkholderiales bacterium]